MAEFKLESEENETAAPLKALFEFIGDFRNFSSILPEDKVEDFTYSETECKFTIRGITSMTVRLDHKEPYQAIHFSSLGLGKFDFKLTARFIGVPEQNGKCSVELSGDMNPFILSMAKAPLQQLVNTMSSRLASLRQEHLV